MEYEKEAEIINFPQQGTKMKVIDTCSFCKKKLIKGKYMQESETSPAICFACVKVCSSLMGLEK